MKLADQSLILKIDVEIENVQGNRVSIFYEMKQIYYEFTYSLKFHVWISMFYHFH